MEIQNKTFGVQGIPSLEAEAMAGLDFASGCELIEAARSAPLNQTLASLKRCRLDPARTLKPKFVQGYDGEVGDAFGVHGGKTVFALPRIVRQARMGRQLV